MLEEMRPKENLLFLYPPSRFMLWGCFDHLDGFPDDAGTEVAVC